MWPIVARELFKVIFRTLNQALRGPISVDDGSPLGSRDWSVPTITLLIQVLTSLHPIHAQISQRTGLGPPPDVAVLKNQIQALQQENLDLRRLSSRPCPRDRPAELPIPR